MSKKEEIDLVDEMNWEDSDKIEKLDLETAGLEERNELDVSFKSGILTYLDWWHDGSASDYTE